ncbi:Oidioi.mRNA.OKI2018_I69.PAR.g8801.t1.cds [Oikopleura dioica]|uniref:Oidioi.mRNA.OKI2018_I69.PAR.g8801.t1.cds n=1 Tax=Oikopleura dioica TaxID=34765 RepID=A0ABN7RL25_OIKDI|nr:Oidioi.mRNA.OKI2018_I69.PAR.g8801.t1.cds [Oikopleura dioica]
MGRVDSQQEKFSGNFRPPDRDKKNNVISLCGKSKPLTHFVTATNVARIRINSDHYGEGLNNKFKLRYQSTVEPSNFSSHQNDKMTTSPAGFVFKQSAVSKDIRVPSGGPVSEKLTSNANRPPRRLQNVRKRHDGRVAIRSGNGFVPRLKLKSAAALPEEPKYEHVAPPNPEDLNPQGWVYQGPDASLLDPNAFAPIPMTPPAQPQAPESHDPWNQHPAPPPPSQIGAGGTPEIIIRPPGWFSNEENSLDGANEDSDEVENGSFGELLSHLGLDIDPLYIILGGGGVATLLLGICIVAMLRRHLREKELAAKQELFKATGPVFRTTTNHNHVKKSELHEIQQRELPSVPSPEKHTSLAKAPAGFQEHESWKASPKYSHAFENSKRKTISLSEEKDTRRSSKGIVSFKKTKSQNRNSRKYSTSSEVDSGMGRTASYPEYDKEGKRVRPAAYRPSLRF